MKAIILAAGRGSRMKHLTEHGPKAMLPLHGKPLIEWQMAALQQAGISELAIVTGYKAEIFHYSVTYFYNLKWSGTQMFSSLLCADEWLSQETCLVCYSDIVYDAHAVQKLMEVQGDIAISFDPNWLTLWKQRFIDPLSDAEVFRYQGERLLDIGGKTDNVSVIQGQYMGLLKFSPAGWANVNRLIQDLPCDKIEKMDMTLLLKALLRNNQEVVVVPIDTPWFEVDCQNDYMLLQQQF